MNLSASQVRLLLLCSKENGHTMQAGPSQLPKPCRMPAAAIMAAP
jgi:hypothetical protein